MQPGENHGELTSYDMRTKHGLDYSLYVRGASCKCDVQIEQTHCFNSENYVPELSTDGSGISFCC